MNEYKTITRTQLRQAIQAGVQAGTRMAKGLPADKAVALERIGREATEVGVGCFEQDCPATMAGMKPSDPGAPSFAAAFDRALNNDYLRGYIGRLKVVD